MFFKLKRRIFELEQRVVEVEQFQYRIDHPLIPTGTKLIVTNGPKFLVEVIESSHGYYDVWEGQYVPANIGFVREKTYRRRLLLKYLDGCVKPYFGNCIEVYNPEIHKDFV